MFQNSVIKKTGKLPGKTLVILAGVHGNERAGILALEELIKGLEIDKGEVYFIYANPKAIEKNVRYIDKNLNRCFLKELTGKSYEEIRARELMPILDKCDALLDLHASNNKKATPFIICGKDCSSLVKIFNFKIVSYGWDDIEPGATDGYMLNQGKPGVCLECGSLYESEKNKNLAYNSSLQFLSYFKAINKKVEHNKEPQKVIRVFKAEKKKTNNFEFVKDFVDFEKLAIGKVFARDGKKEYIAGEKECIIFPNKEVQVGDEVFILGKNNK